VAGWTHCSVTILRRIRATCLQCTASVPHEATNIHGNDDALLLHHLLTDNFVYLKAFATSVHLEDVSCDVRAS